MPKYLRTPLVLGHSININTCGMWEVRAGIQVSRKEFHIHIRLNYNRV